MDSDQHLQKAQAELVSTEETYVDQLRKLCFGQKFLSRHCDNSLQDSIAVVFQHVPTLLELHQELLRKMKLNPERPHEGLLDAVDFLKLTQNYAKAFPHASATFQRLCEGKKFRAFVANLELETNGLTFSSLLITPVQRLPRYRLLMNEILMHTPASSPDRLAVEEVYGKVCEVATSVNEYVRRAATVAKFGQELASLKMNRFRHLLSSESQPIRSALIEGRTSEGTFKPRRLIMFSDVLVLTNSKLICRAAFRLADIVSYHEDPNTMNSLFIEAGEHEITAQLSTTTERDQWANEVSQRTVLIKQKELEKLVRASSSLSSPSACLSHRPPPKQPLPRRPFHDATNVRPLPPLKRTLSYSSFGSSSIAGATPPGEGNVIRQSNLAPSRFSSLANTKAREREQCGDSSPFTTPSKASQRRVSLDTVRYKANSSSQNQLFSLSPKEVTERLVSPSSSVSRPTSTLSRSSACSATPAMMSPKFQQTGRMPNQPPKLARRLQNTALPRRHLPPRVCIEGALDSTRPSDLNSHQRSVRKPPVCIQESPVSSQSEFDLSLSPIGSPPGWPDSSSMSSSGSCDWSDLSDALAEPADVVDPNCIGTSVVPPNPNFEDCPPPTKPVYDAADSSNLHQRENRALDIPSVRSSGEDKFRLDLEVDESANSSAPIPKQLTDNVNRESGGAFEQNNANEEAAAAGMPNDVELQRIALSPGENFYRAIYFSPERQAEVEQVLQSLPKCESGPRNLPVYVANRLKSTRDEENCFTEEKFGMELRVPSVKAFLEERDMPSDNTDVYAFIQCRKLELATFWIEQTCFEQVCAILPRCIDERAVVVDLLSKVQYNIEEALQYLIDDGRFQS